MFRTLLLSFGTLMRLFRSRREIVLENLVLRQQLVVPKRRHPRYGIDVPTAIRSLGITPLRTSFESPWQNGVAERWVESCRRDLLDHVVAINEKHLKRLLAEYVHYYQEDRTYLGLAKETPAGRDPSIGSGSVLSHPRLGGLHHRYERAA